ncbi:BnaA08g11810D [Brassica napus]|uniref:Non-specific lipid-transfer protein n=1 Tax=Brassica napus TaxID=3708 RepID=A0A078I7E1_BRANA|nr:unnamed protein product [Brassica napus]CDY45038.1 BnaA08g11810D [Brassica napus]
MGNITKNQTMLLLVVTLLMVIAYHEGEAIQCSQITMYLAPCLSYVKGGGNPPPPCCAGLNNLKSSAPGRPDKQAACQCLKNVANAISGFNDDNAKQLPAKCGVSVGVPFSKSVDCNRKKCNSFFLVLNEAQILSLAFQGKFIPKFLALSQVFISPHSTFTNC